MPVTRRSFIKNSAMATAGTLLIPDILSAETYPQMPSDDLDEAVYWKAIRNQYPLSTNRAYLNNGTMGPMPYPVLNAAQNTLADLARTGEYSGWEGARKSIADLVHADEAEISLTHNTTEGINIIAWGLPLKKEDEVIMTSHEHVGNALPWLNRMRLHGIVIRTFQPALTAAENLNRINGLITKKTRAIAVPHILCTTGTLMPVKEISKLGKDKNLFVMIDGAHGAGSMPLDVKDIGCDFYAGCSHKWLCAPSGTGFLYVRKELLDTVQAYWVGGYSDKGFDITANPPTFKGYIDTAHRYDFATQNAAIYKGVEAAVIFMNEIGLERVQSRIRGLAKYLQNKLLAMPDKVEMLTPTEEASRAMMIGFRLKTMDYQKFGELATKEGFRIRLVPESGLNSVRISTHIYNQEAELDRLVELVSKG
jgi:selenocysteine lyase/cysteine desulfurase